MKKFKVIIEPAQYVDKGEIVLEAETAEQAGELAEELFDEDPTQFDWPSSDCSELDVCNIVSIEELESKQHENKQT